MVSSPLLASHVQFGEPSQSLASRVGNLYQHTSTIPPPPVFLVPPGPSLSKLSASRDSPQILSLHTWDPRGLLRGCPAWSLGSQCAASPPLCVQPAPPGSLFQPLPDSVWSGGDLVPDAAGSRGSWKRISVSGIPGRESLCTFPLE